MIAIMTLNELKVIFLWLKPLLIPITHKYSAFKHDVFIHINQKEHM